MRFNEIVDDWWLVVKLVLFYLFVVVLYGLFWSVYAQVVDEKPVDIPLCEEFKIQDRCWDGISC